MDEYNSYLIPANSKKSKFMLSFLNGVDLAILLTGVGISFLLMMILPVKEIWVGVIAIFPGFLAVFLVFPVANYHNVRTVIKNAWNFYTTPREFKWKGWCFSSGEKRR